MSPEKERLPFYTAAFSSRDMQLVGNDFNSSITDICSSSVPTAVGILLLGLPLYPLFRKDALLTEKSLLLPLKFASFQSSSQKLNLLMHSLPLTLRI